MKTALLIVAALAIVFGLLTGLTFSAANRSGDDFGSGFLAWVCAGVTVLLIVVELVLGFIYMVMR